MKSSLEDFGTGWYGLALGLKRTEIDDLVANLIEIRDQTLDHFQSRGSFEGAGGLADIEFYIVSEETKDDLVFDYSPPIEPTR